MAIEVDFKKLSRIDHLFARVLIVKTRSKHLNTYSPSEPSESTGVRFTIVIPDLLFDKITAQSIYRSFEEMSDRYALELGVAIEQKVSPIVGKLREYFYEPAIPYNKRAVTANLKFYTSSLKFFIKDEDNEVNPNTFTLGGHIDALIGVDERKWVGPDPSSALSVEDLTKKENWEKQSN